MQIVDKTIQEHIFWRDVSDEPVKYIFLFGPPGFNTAYIIEMSWISTAGYGKNTVHEFISQEDFNEIIKFHSTVKYHCPILKQSWLASSIDLWEDSSDFVIYNTRDEAIAAAKKYKENL